jgi:outer membrane receptor protein involved in Fe transport
VQPRLSAFLNLNEGLVLEGAVGRFAQMPSLPVSVPGFESFGLKSLGLQTSDAASLGLQATGLGWQTSMTGFFQRMRLSDITNIEIEGMNPTRENYLEMRDGTSYGVETLVRKRNEGRAYGWLAYTLSWSRHAVHGVVGPSDFDQRHVLNVVGGYRLDHGLTVGGRLHLHTGRYAPIFGKPTQETPDTYRRLPTYAQLDLRVARHFVFDRLLMDLFLDLGNVAFQKEVIEWARDPATGQVEQRTLHIILPTIGVHIVY